MDLARNCGVVLVLMQPQPNMLWLERSQMFIDFEANHFLGAPAEGNVLMSNVEPDISLLWSEEPQGLKDPINTRSLRD